jgi:RimJ/RimL family protein N-acetyltransferase
LNFLADQNNSVTSTTGYVMPQNIASVKVFERLGFEVATENNQLRFTKTIIRS